MKYYHPGNDTSVFAITPTLPPGTKKVDIVAPGLYTYRPTSPFTGEPEALRKSSWICGEKSIIETDDHALLIDAVNQFTSEKTREIFDQMQIMWRIGILIYGRPGTGKTISMYYAAQAMVELGFVVVTTTIKNVSRATNFVRYGKPDQVMAFLFDECEYDIMDDEHEYINVLDGVKSMPGTIFIMATNMFDEIPARIKYRPSRVSKIIEFKTPSAKIVSKYIEQKTAEIKHLDAPKIITIEKACVAEIEKSGGLTIDQIKAVIIAVAAYDIDPQEAVDRISKIDEEYK